MSKTLVIDANLIILLIVGLADENLVSRHKRTRTYSVQDFRLLVSIVANYREVVTLPNVLSEVSNLLSFEADDHSRRILATFIKFIETAEERYIASGVGVTRSEFSRLGLSDSVILEAAKGDVHILTADLALHLAALNAGYQSVNFTHLIDAARA